MDPELISDTPEECDVAKRLALADKNGRRDLGPSPLEGLYIAWARAREEVQAYEEARQHDFD
jgi:hypothetical protein